jgi:O-succinylbenzoic acid--CoA ligase
MIRSGGENVWPQHVEAVLRTHPRIADVAVAGRPDEEWGERVVAYVVPAAGPGGPPSLDELRELVKSELGPFAAPRQLVLVEDIPRTAIGKTRRSVLGT